MVSGVDEHTGYANSYGYAPGRLLAELYDDDSRFEINMLANGFEEQTYLYGADAFELILDTLGRRSLVIVCGDGSHYYVSYYFSDAVTFTGFIEGVFRTVTLHSDGSVSKQEYALTKVEATE